MLSLISDSVPLTTYFPVLCPAVVSPPRYICLSTPSLLRYYPSSTVVCVDPTTYAPSSNLVSSASSTLIPREGTGSPRFLRNPLDSMPWTMTPVEFHHLADNDGFVAVFRVPNHVDSLHNISIFGAEHLHPFGLRPTASLSTLHPCSYPHERKTRF